MSFGVLLFVAVLQQLTYLLKSVSKLFYIYIMYVRRFGSADLSGSYTYSRVFFANHVSERCLSSPFIFISPAVIIHGHQVFFEIR